jgi:hypothetical protein
VFITIRSKLKHLGMCCMVLIYVMMGSAYSVDHPNKVNNLAMLRRNFGLKSVSDAFAQTRCLFI